MEGVHYGLREAISRWSPLPFHILPSGSTSSTTSGAQSNGCSAEEKIKIGSFLSHSVTSGVERIISDIKIVAPKVLVDSGCQWSELDCIDTIDNPAASDQLLSPNSVVCILNSLSSDVLFEPGYSLIAESSGAALDRIAELVTTLGLSVMIEGRINTVNKKGIPVKTDNRRVVVLEDCKPEELALRRAEKVAKSLADRGVSREMIKAMYSATNRPVTLDPNSLQLNRFVT